MFYRGHPSGRIFLTLGIYTPYSVKHEEYFYRLIEGMIFMKN